MSRSVSIGQTTIADVNGERKVFYKHGTYQTIFRLFTQEDWDDFVQAVKSADKRLKWGTKE